MILFVLAGCTSWEEWTLLKPEKPPAGADTLILRGDQLVPEKPINDPKVQEISKDLAGAHELYRLGQFEKAEAVFHYIAELKKSPPTIAEEARFYEAECLRRQEKYPKASDTYHKTLMDWPSGSYREQCCQRLFDIANFWLEDTRVEMQARDAGKEHWYSWVPVAHWEKERPLFDEEGRAVEALEWVHVNDITGPLADKSLFLAGSVMFFRENYRESDHYFTMLVQDHHNSPLVPQAIELGIISKHLSTGGSDYDGRKVAEARQLINTALSKYPVLATEKKDFLVRQLCACTMQQAEKDFKIAEFYKRTGHPGSAYFYYEIVRRRYPGTPFYDQATTRMIELRAELEKEHASLPPDPGNAKAPTLPAKPNDAAAPAAPKPEAAPAPQPTPADTTPPPPPRTLAPVPGVTGGKPN